VAATLLGVHVHKSSRRYANGHGEGARAESMIAILIFGISVLTLLQFFVLYSHSLIAESRGYELSEHGREIAGVTGRIVRSDQFRRLLQLIALCPEPGGDTGQVRAVSMYFELLGLVRVLFGWIEPAVAGWIESERSGCAYVAAVMLDRRISYNRVLMARQMSAQL
jgi:hypothetical protein